MSARHLVIGLDGADWDVVDAIGPARLPSLAGLRARGAWSRLRTVRPPATLPNWTTFLTGVDPGAHGVFDFTTRDGYAVRFTGGTVRTAPTILARLDALGLPCACVGFPATWPPEPLAHGIAISGWDSPVAFEADRSFVHPPALFDGLVERFGPLRFDDVGELEGDGDDWHRTLADRLAERVARKTALAEWILAERAWHVAAFYFGESDTAAHHLWSLWDARSPRRPPNVSARDADGLARVYVALDASVGRLVAAAGGDGVEITIVSDHGSGGSGDAVLYLNRALADAGLLSLRRSSRPARAMSAATRAAKEIALRRVPPRVRERLFRAADGALPGALESRARFGEIDFARTVAFSEELNYFPSVWLNVRDREPDGTIAPGDVPAVRREVAAALRAIRDPWTGAPVVAAVHAREDLYRGPHVERAPDLIVDLHAPGGYTYNLMPSSSAPPGSGTWRRLAPEEHLGSKGRSLPGSHRDRGVFVAAGPRVAATGEIDAHIADATATLLARMDVAVPYGFAGRVLWEALAGPAATSVLRVAPAVAPRGLQGGDESEVLARLRALGYAD